MKGENEAKKISRGWVERVKKSDFWWLLWGTLIAFGLQVLYDGLGQIPNFTNQFWYGLGIEAISWILLFTWGTTMKRELLVEPEGSKQTKCNMTT